MMESMSYCIIQVFIKAFVFYNFGLSVMIQTKELINLTVDEKYHWYKYGPWYDATKITTYMALYLSISFLLYFKIDMN